MITGKTIETTGGMISYKADGRYEYYSKSNGATFRGKWSVRGDQVCVDFDAGDKRCNGQRVLHLVPPEYDAELNARRTPNRPAAMPEYDKCVPHEAWARLDPPQRRRATLDAVRHMLLRESERRPLLLVFEDLHWLDSESQALLDYFTRQRGRLQKGVLDARIIAGTDGGDVVEHAAWTLTARALLNLDEMVTKE